MADLYGDGEPEWASPGPEGDRPADQDGIPAYPPWDEGHAAERRAGVPAWVVALVLGLAVLGWWLGVHPSSALLFGGLHGD